MIDLHSVGVVHLLVVDVVVGGGLVDRLIGRLVALVAGQAAAVEQRVLLGLAVCH